MFDAYIIMLFSTFVHRINEVTIFLSYDPCSEINYSASTVSILRAIKSESKNKGGVYIVYPKCDYAELSL